MYFTLVLNSSKLPVVIIWIFNVLAILSMNTLTWADQIRPDRIDRDSRKYQPESLIQVLQRVERTYATGERPVVMFDLDETLINSRVRTLRILKDIALNQQVAEEYPFESNVISRMGLSDVRSYPLYLGEILRSIGIEDASFIKSIEGDYLNQYLSNNYCASDWTISGAAEYVRAVQEAGAWIVYLTGRNRPGMEKCTVESLRRNRFPLGTGERSLLFMKPTREIDDTEYKKTVLSEIGAIGVVVDGFENEPANINAFKAAFPKSTMVFIDTIHSNRPNSPRVDIPWVKDFRVWKHNVN